MWIRINLRARMIKLCEMPTNESCLRFPFSQEIVIKILNKYFFKFSNIRSVFFNDVSVFIITGSNPKVTPRHCWKCYPQ